MWNAPVLNSGCEDEFPRGSHSTLLKRTVTRTPNHSEPMSVLIQTILVMTLIVFGLHRLFLVMTVLSQKKTHTGPGSEDLIENRRGQHGVSVLVQVPIYNEPHVVLRIIQSVTKLEYPKENLSIQILDDSSDETSAIIDEFMEKQDGSLDIKVIRRTQRTGFKAGALQHGLNGSAHEFVAVFDADFTPPSNFLTNCLILKTRKSGWFRRDGPTETEMRPCSREPKPSFLMDTFELISMHVH